MIRWTQTWLKYPITKTSLEIKLPLFGFLNSSLCKFRRCLIDNFISYQLDYE
jgi:hypothetical protein